MGPAGAVARARASLRASVAWASAQYQGKFAAPGRNSALTLIAIVALLTGGIVLSVEMAQFQFDDNLNDDVAHVHRRCKEMTDTVEEFAGVLDTLLNLLSKLTALGHVAADMDPVGRVVSDLAVLPWWASAIHATPGELDALEAQMRAEFGENVALQQLDVDGVTLVPLERTRDHYYIMNMVLPLSGSQAMVGVDAYTLPGLAETIDATTSQHVMQLSPLVVDPVVHEPRLFAMNPVFTDVRDDSSDVSGVVLMALDPQLVLSAPLRTHRDTLADLFLFDKTGLAYTKFATFVASSEFTEYHMAVGTKMTHGKLLGKLGGSALVLEQATFVGGRVLRWVCIHPHDHPSWSVTRTAVAVGGSVFTVLITLAISQALMQSLRTERLNSSLSTMNEAYERFVPAESIHFLGRRRVADVQLGDAIHGVYTVLFVDLRAFTSIAEDLTPQETFHLLNEYLCVVAPVIREQQGWIDKFLGDGVVGVFPHHSTDAMRAAVDIFRAVEKLNEARAEEGDESLRIGVGMHTGHVMLGVIGESERMECTVISDSVNIASRLEGLTKRLGANVLFTQALLDNVYDLTAFRFRYIGRVRVYGKRRPLEVYQLLMQTGDEYVLWTKRHDFNRAVKLFQAGELGEAQVLFEEAAQEHADEAARVYLNYIARQPVVIAETWTGVLGVMPDAASSESDWSRSPRSVDHSPRPMRRPLPRDGATEADALLEGRREGYGASLGLRVPRSAHGDDGGGDGDGSDL